MTGWPATAWLARLVISAAAIVSTALCAIAQDIPFLAPQGAPAAAFPTPTVPHADVISPIWHTEAERDAADESGQIVQLLGLKPGMTVGDIGAGSGYLTVRLAKVVLPGGRIIAQDLTPAYLAGLAKHIAELGLVNVTLGRGEAHDPRLPAASLDAAVMVHMYHEIAQPYAFLHNLRLALKPDAQVAIVDRDAPKLEHGTPSALLRCELAAAGYQQTAFHKLKGLPAYLAVFSPTAAGNRLAPGDIVACKLPR